MQNSSLVCAAQRKQSAEYQELDREQEALRTALLDKLGEDRSYLNRYEEAWNGKAALEWEWEWREAFCECVQLLRWMGALNGT